MRGREGSGPEARDAVFACEISRTASDNDVARAAGRAATLRAAGLNAYAAVLGQRISDRVAKMAADSGVEVFVDRTEEEEAPQSVA